MKRAYVRPTMVGERFVANEYVAACWKIYCNVPNGYGYIDNDKNGQFSSGDKLLTPRYELLHGCHKWHTGVKGVPDDGPKENAMWHPSFSVGNKSKCIIRYIEYKTDGNSCLFFLYPIMYEKKL